MRNLDISKQIENENSTSAESRKGLARSEEESQYMANAAPQPAQEDRATNINFTPGDIILDILRGVLNNATDIAVRSEQYANTQNEKRLARFHKKAEEDKKQVEADSVEASRGKLTKRQQKDLNESKGTDKYKKVEKILEKKTTELAAKDIKKIDDLLAAKTQSSQDQIPEDRARKKQEYDNFLQDTGHHPLSFPTLDFANDDMDMAKTIIDQIKKFPRLSEFIKGEGSIKLWQSTTGALGSAITASLLERISLKQLKSFADTSQGLSLLKDLYAQADTDNLNLQKVASHLSSFEPYIQNEESKALLIPLLASQKAEDLKLLFEVIKTIPGNTEPVELITTLLPFTEDANVLLESLKYALKIRLNQEQMITIIKSVKHGWHAEAIKNKINETALKIIDKDQNNGREFKQWMKVLDALIDHAGFTIKVGELKPLSGGNTDERHCYVNGKHDRSHTFEIHYHPEAVKPTLDNPNASKIHIKPNPGNRHTNRIFDNELKNSKFGYGHVYGQLVRFLRIERRQNS